MRLFPDFSHCRIKWWAAPFCWLDNWAPHAEMLDDSEPICADDDGPYYYLAGRRGFQWICRLHCWAQDRAAESIYGKYDPVTGRFANDDA